MGLVSMIKIINIELHKNNKLDKKYSKIKSIHHDDTYICTPFDAKTSLNENIFTRETKDYKFELNINKKVASYFLKEKNILFDIEVEKALYTKEKNNIILEYKIDSEEQPIKIVVIESK